MTDEKDLIDTEMATMVVAALQAVRDALKEDQPINIRLQAANKVLDKFEFKQRSLKQLSYKDTQGGHRAKNILDLVDELRSGSENINH